MDQEKQDTSASETARPKESKDDREARKERFQELGGRDGPEPTRFGDWEKGGRCIDF